MLALLLKIAIMTQNKYEDKHIALHHLVSNIINDLLGF